MKSNGCNSRGVQPLMVLLSNSLMRESEGVQGTCPSGLFSYNDYFASILEQIIIK